MHPCSRHGVTTKPAALLIAAALALGSTASAGAQTIGFNVRTGDVWVDNRLGEINDYGMRYRDPFVTEVVTYYAVPRPYVEELLVRRHWAPADVYYACGYAHSIGRPCSEIVDVYDRGHGWGAVSQRYGIRPGSPQFHAFKNGFVGTYGRWGHPIVIDRVTHVRWDENGHRGHGDRDWDDHGHAKHVARWHEEKREMHHDKNERKSEKHEWKQEKHGHGHGDEGHGNGHGDKGHGHDKH